MDGAQGDLQTKYHKIAGEYSKVSLILSNAYYCFIEPSRLISILSSFIGILFSLFAWSE